MVVEEQESTTDCESSLLIATNNSSVAAQLNDSNKQCLTSRRICHGCLLVFFLAVGVLYSRPGMSPALLHPQRFESMIVENTAMKIEHIHENPLREFVARSAGRGACHADGTPSGFPTPWSMTLGLQGPAAGAAPALRSIGIQGVTEKSIYFVCRGGPGGVAGPPAGLGEYNASMMHLAGNYPGAMFEEQWRAEGSVREVTIEALQLHGLPAPDTELLIQILATADFAEHRSTVQAGSLAPITEEGRIEISPDVPGEVNYLDNAVSRARSAAEKSDKFERDATHAGMRIYALTPWRVEVLHGGPDWPEGPMRVEWRRQPSLGEHWLPPSRILPYSWP
mmetsp:Transcript_40192/g.97086  ORF Transcript_40192/g.97086 Transcript_40192/m.97086 type:complete len:337 (-) Transcript_40192:1966-2976(-)